MSNAAPPAWVRELALPSGAWRCLVGLWGFAKYGTDGPAQVWPARETLAAATGQKPATVAKQLRKLADLRWILRAPNGVLWLAWRIPWSSARIPWSSDTPVVDTTTTVTGPDTPVVGGRILQSSHNLQGTSKNTPETLEEARATRGDAGRTEFGVSDKLDTPNDTWAARVKAASPSAHYHLSMSDGPAPSYAGLLEQARHTYGDESVLEVMRAWESGSAARPPANKLWWRSWAPWVERLLGIEAPTKATTTKRSPNGQAAFEAEMAKVAARRLEVVS